MTDEKRQSTGWTIKESSLVEEALLTNESLFSLGNGYLGVRGNFEEGYGPAIPSIRGTYLNGFYDTANIHYGEKAYGFPDTRQVLVNCIDAQGFELYLGEDQEHFSLFSGQILKYERTLHLDKGFSERKIHWRSPGGKEIRLTFQRLVSFAHRELFTIQISIEPINFHGMVTLRSSVNGDVKNYTDPHDSRVGSGDGSHLRVVKIDQIGDRSLVLSETATSHLLVSCVSSIQISVKTENSIDQSDSSIQSTIRFSLDKPVSVLKQVIYTDSLRHGSNPVKKGLTIHDRLWRKTFSEILTEQSNEMARFWKTSDVQIDGDDQLQEGLRFNLFHLLQSAGRDSACSIAAKGLSGEGYEGHYFWDTEIFMLPFFTLTQPDIAKDLLIYRYSILEQARSRAKEMGHKRGALFPWRTIAGPECSAFFPAGTAQYHISADIAYSFIQYYLATNDRVFLVKYGMEILAETARLWMETGHYFNGQFHIDAVTGPDEYTAIVNNNYYTNVLAKYNLNWASSIYRFLEKYDRETLKNLSDKLELSDSEVISWSNAGQAMYLPYDKKKNINPQDDTFLRKAVWNFEETPKDHYPLLLHYHPLTLYRYQVCKQADTVLAHFLVEDAANSDTIKNSYHYYEKITTHDSSLSTCIFSIMAAKLGEKEKAIRYFANTVRLDLDNVQGNTKDGLHLANMGGAWMVIVFGFAGVRLKKNGLSLHPMLPETWNRCTFSLVYLGQRIAVELRRQSITCTLVEGTGVKLHVNDRLMTLSGGESKTVPMHVLEV